MKRTLLIGAMLLLAGLAHADGDIGFVASNTNDILDNIISIVTAIMYIASFGVFVSATMKYRIHRQNPQQIPLSTPLTELLLAIVLAALPTVSRMSNGILFNTAPKAPVAPAYTAPRGVTPAQPAQPQQVQPAQQPQG